MSRKPRAAQPLRADQSAAKTASPSKPKRDRKSKRGAAQPEVVLAPHILATAVEVYPHLLAETDWQWDPLYGFVYTAPTKDEFDAMCRSMRKGRVPGYITTMDHDNCKFADGRYSIIDGRAEWLAAKDRKLPVYLIRWENIQADYQGTVGDYLFAKNECRRHATATIRGAAIETELYHLGADAAMRGRPKADAEVETVEKICDRRGLNFKKVRRAVSLTRSIRKLGGEVAVLEAPAEATPEELAVIRVNGGIDQVTKLGMAGMSATALERELKERAGVIRPTDVVDHAGKYVLQAIELLLRHQGKNKSIAELGERDRERLQYAADHFDQDNGKDWWQLRIENNTILTKMEQSKLVKHISDFENELKKTRDFAKTLVPKTTQLIIEPPELQPKPKKKATKAKTTKATKAG